MGRTAESDPVAQLSLPPGFRFFPTDEELLVHYLCRKAAGQHFSLQLIGDIDLYKFDPWVLPSKALFGEKEWYFFSPRDRKYPNGSRPNRVAGSGYWKATGTDKIITTHGKKVGIKKALVFYIGKAPKGIKTNWIMHEYRLSDPARKKGSIRLDDWVLCRIYKKNSSSQKQSPPVKEDNAAALDVLDYLPEIDDCLIPLPRMNSIKSLQDEKFSFQGVAPGAGKMDWFSAPAFPTVPSIGQVDSYSEIPGSSIEEEVESSLISQQMEDNKNNINACFFQQSLSPFSFDPFSGSTGYSMHPACFGQGQ